MTPEEQIEVPRSPREMVEDALDASIMAAGVLVGDFKPLIFDIVESDDEADITMPIKVVFPEGAQSTPSLVLHEDTFLNFAEELQARYPSITPLDVAKVYVSTTVIPLIALSRLDQFNADKVDRLYDHMSHADSLEESIVARLLELGESETLARLAVMSRDEQGVCIINRYRLAMGTLSFYESVAGSEAVPSRQAVDFSVRTEQSAFAELIELPLQMRKYVKTAAALGSDTHTAEQQFFSRISDLELAMAFPMSAQEIALIASCIK